MTEAAPNSDLTVILGPTTPAEACANCGAFRPSNRRLWVVEIQDEEAPPVIEADETATAS